jgi:crossover junction endodeoxyribonuclease RusA
VIAFDLPFPVKALWPNGRAHWAVKGKAVRSHRGWAYIAARDAGVAKADPDSRVSIAVTVHPKTRHPIDRDNCVAALKSYIDGIADALGVDDRNFETPTITFGDPIKGGLFSVVLTVTPYARIAA